MADDLILARPRARRVLGALLGAALLASALPATVALPAAQAQGSSAAVASVVPVTPTFPSGIDAAAGYEGQTLCTPAPKPGTKKLAALLTRTYGRASIGISRPCSDGGQSEHKEGRALDWMVSYRVPAQRAKATAFLAWLLAPGADGTPAAMARRIGVMYIGWNNRMWRAYGQQGWGELKGCLSDPRKKARAYDTLCHRNHVHVSLSWDGAAGLTSMWDGTPVAAACPSPWNDSSVQPSTSLTFVPVRPARVLDTRTGLGVDGTPCRLGAARWSGDSRTLPVPVAGVGDVPETGVAAVALRLTALNPNTSLALRASTTASSPAVPVLSTTMRASASSTVVLPVAADGTVRLSLTYGGTDVLADVVGWAPLVDPTAVPAAGNTHPQPLTTAATGVLAAGETAVVPLAGHGGVPATPISGLHTVVTVWGGTSARGGVRIGSVGPGDVVALPSTATVAATGSTPRSATAVVASGDGRIVLVSGSASPLHYRVDVAAWYGPAEDTTGLVTDLRRPVTVVRSSTRLGVAGALVAGRSVTVTPTLAAVPAGVQAVLLQVTATGTAWGDLVLGPTASSSTPRSLGLRPGLPVTELVLVRLSAARTFGLRAVGGRADVTASVVGYLR